MLSLQGACRHPNAGLLWGYRGDPGNTLKLPPGGSAGRTLKHIRFQPDSGGAAPPFEQNDHCAETFPPPRFSTDFMCQSDYTMTSPTAPLDNLANIWHG